MSKEAKAFIGVGIGFCLAFFLLNVFVMDNDWSMAETLFRTGIVVIVWCILFGGYAFMLAKKKKNV